MNRTARIAQLRESIARHALASTTTLPADTRILDVRRIRDIFIVTTENPSNQWASHYVETFRIPTADDTDLNYEPGQGPKIWTPLAGWSSDSADEVPALIDQAIAYANHDLAA